LLLLKNEISLNFIKKEETLVNIVRIAFQLAYPNKFDEKLTKFYL